MKALILAAGLGSRLAPLTNELPKSLVPVNGKPILFKQIENLHENNINDITIVSGYKADILSEAVINIWPDVNIVKSVDFMNTNNMYSAYLGMNTMFSNSTFEPFIMMNADVFYDSSVIRSLIDDFHDDAIIVDIGRYLDESMKVVENNGRLVSISKKISKDDALGTSIDVYKFSAFGGKSFFEHCMKYIEEKKELKLWSEVALNDTLFDIDFYACPLNGRWMEIDNHDDLAAAEEIFAK